MGIDTSRFLIDRDGEGAMTFLIESFRPSRPGPDQAQIMFVEAVFTTGGVNGKSAIDTAIGNLADASEGFDGELTLRAVPETPSDPLMTIAVAEQGACREV